MTRAGAHWNRWAACSVRRGTWDGWRRVAGAVACTTLATMSPVRSWPLHRQRSRMDPWHGGVGRGASTHVQNDCFIQAGMFVFGTRHPLVGYAGFLFSPGCGVGPGCREPSAFFFLALCASRNRHTTATGLMTHQPSPTPVGCQRCRRRCAPPPQWG